VLNMHIQQQHIKLARTLMIAAIDPLFLPVCAVVTPGPYSESICFGECEHGKML
jgi:hypothetical protein